MRKFAKIDPRFWSREKVKKLSPRAKLAAIYLMTSDRFQMIGIYRLPLYVLEQEIGINEEQAVEVMNELSEVDFCRYDNASEVVWVVDMAATQVADNPNERQLKGVVNELNRLHDDGEYPFVNQFHDMYCDRYNLPDLDDLNYDMD